MIAQLPLLADLGPEPNPPPGSSDEWYTPRPLFEQRNRKHRFTIDVAANAESAKCPRFFTAYQDGLAQSWGGERVWCNPPYSDIAPWVAKADWAMKWEACELVEMLLPSWTDRPWWHEHIEPYRDGKGWLRSREGRVVLVDTTFLTRFSFGYPGDPDGLHSESPRTFTVLVTWRLA